LINFAGRVTTKPRAALAALPYIMRHHFATGSETTQTRKNLIAEGGSQQVPLDRIYFLQQWFDLSDPGAEESLYDSRSMRCFVGIDLGREPVRDETTICNFRHLLERHDLGQRLFEAVHEHLERRGIKIARGTIVDAIIISAPSSTKNSAAVRDPDMCHTRKDKQWYFGMKARIGVDNATKVIHKRGGNRRQCCRLHDPARLAAWQ
jgi:hypothetical protein